MEHGDYEWPFKIIQNIFIYFIINLDLLMCNIVLEKEIWTNIQALKKELLICLSHTKNISKCGYLIKFR